MRRALVLFILLLHAAAGCGFRAAQPGGDTFVLATTTSTQDSGLLDVLTAEFEKAHPRLRVKVIAVGSGEAIELGRRGDADVLLAHSPDQEEAFVREGRGVFRKPVMSNDFVIAGPDNDPARIRGVVDAVVAFTRVASARAEFLSRADESGTHARELKTWKAAGIVPGGEWYLETGQGMAETLIVASERGAYLLTDTATLRSMEAKVGLLVLSSKDPLLVNPYSVIPVVGARKTEAGLAFAEWITGSKGQAFIGAFGRDRNGTPLFVPKRIMKRS